MSDKPAIEDSIPLARRRSGAPKAPPENPPNEAPPADEQAAKTGRIQGGTLADLASMKAMARPNAKGAVNLTLSPDLKQRLDNAYFATKIPRVQIATVALEEFLKRNGY